MNVVDVVDVVMEAVGAVELVEVVELVELEDVVEVVDVIVLVLTSLISVPLRSPVTNASALALEPAQVAKSALIRLDTVVSPRVGARESMVRVCVASVEVPVVSAA